MSLEACVLSVDSGLERFVDKLRVATDPSGIIEFRHGQLCLDIPEDYLVSAVESSMIDWFLFMARIYRQYIQEVTWWWDDFNMMFRIYFTLQPNTQMLLW